VSQTAGGRRRVPPRWLLRAGWAVHRAVYTISGGRLGLRTAADERLGTLRLTTIGRRSGEKRIAMLFYLDDGPNLAVVASNAGAPEDPGWWRNLQARPSALVDVAADTRSVRAREADEDERARLWPRFVTAMADYERYATVARRPIPIVILEPSDERAGV
jgi:F420H(2)-dependent quinone reductase